MTNNPWPALVLEDWQDTLSTLHIGNGAEAAFYSYTAPEPAGLAEISIEPRAAFYSKEMKEFLLPYDAVRQSPSPETALMDFLQSTYEAGATLAKWDRKALERVDHQPRLSAEDNES